MRPYNTAWKSCIAAATQQSALDVSYFDVWDLSVQRGDAHLLPPTDCLHFCYQSAVEEWQQVCMGAFKGCGLSLTCSGARVCGRISLAVALKRITTGAGPSTYR